MHTQSRGRDCLDAAGVPASDLRGFVCNDGRLPSRPQAAPSVTGFSLQRPEVRHHPKRELRVSEPVTLTDDLGVQQ